MDFSKFWVKAGKPEEVLVELNLTAGRIADMRKLLNMYARPYGEAYDLTFCNYKDDAYLTVEDIKPKTDILIRFNTESKKVYEVISDKEEILEYKEKNLKKYIPLVRFIQEEVVGLLNIFYLKSEEGKDLLIKNIDDYDDTLIKEYLRNPKDFMVKTETHSFMYYMTLNIQYIGIEQASMTYQPYLKLI